MSWFDLKVNAVAALGMSFDDSGFRDARDRLEHLKELSALDARVLRIRVPAY
jgi:hypothetical protein